MLQLKYTLDNVCGWATLMLTNPKNQSSTPISASYLRDTLFELCHKMTEYLKDNKQQRIISECEPGVIALELLPIKNNTAKYRVLLFEDEIELNNPETLDEGLFSPIGLANDIIISCSDILNELGVDNYMNKWLEHPFPMESYLKLKQVVDNPDNREKWRDHMTIINTGNKNKQAEFQRFFKGDTVFLNYDIEEPKGNEIEIIRYKASRFKNVIVDDTSLYIKGKELGPLIKWNLTKLEQYVGETAVFSCLLAKHHDKKVFISKGEVSGRICKKQGDGFGFTPYFIPDGSQKSLAQDKPDHLNARYLASKKILDNKWDMIVDRLYEWSGEFQ